MTLTEKNIIKKQWYEFYEIRGIAEQDKEYYRQYVSALIDKGVPPIVDFDHLCLLLGYEKEFVSSVVNHPNSFYRIFTIPKKAGGKREITAPYPALKDMQRWIYDNILSALSVHGCAHGFVHKRSIITNAKNHIGQRCLLKMDLKDFFPSININWVINIFKDLGYSDKVSFYLSAICCLDEKLPQGAPTSPVLSNIISRTLDKRLYRLAKSFHLKYSRYADDIAFSGDNISQKFISVVRSIIESYGLIVNDKKIKLYKGYGSKILTGVSLANEIVRIPRKYRRMLVQELYYINKYGLYEHMRRRNINKVNYAEVILGKLNFWLQVEPQCKYALRMKNMIKTNYTL